MIHIDESILAALFVLVIGAGAAGGAATETEVERRFTDEAIRKAVYDKSYTVCDGFCQDPDLSKRKELAKKKTVISVRFERRRNDDGTWSYATADSLEAARAMVEQTLKRGSRHMAKTISKESQTAWYHQFRCQKTTRGRTYALLHRVIKSSFLKSLDTRGGTFAKAPVTPDMLRLVAEATWYLRSYNVQGFKCLASAAREVDGELTYTLWTTQFVGGDWGITDEITLFRIVHRADPKTGVFTIEHKKLRAIKGKRN